MSQSPEILAPCPVGEQDGRVFESGLDLRAQNKCPSKERGGGPAQGWRSPDRHAFLEMLTLSLKIGHEAAPTCRWICLPGTPPFKRVFLSLSLSIFSLSLRLALLSVSSRPHFAPFPLSPFNLFFLSSCSKDGESRVRNKITKCDSDCRGGGGGGNRLRPLASTFSWSKEVVGGGSGEV